MKRTDFADFHRFELSASSRVLPGWSIRGKDLEVETFRDRTTGEVYQVGVNAARYRKSSLPTLSGEVAYSPWLRFQSEEEPRRA